MRMCLLELVPGAGLGHKKRRGGGSTGRTAIAEEAPLTTGWWQQGVEPTLPEATRFTAPQRTLQKVPFPFLCPHPPIPLISPLVKPYSPFRKSTNVFSLPFKVSADERRLAGMDSNGLGKCQNDRRPIVGRRSRFKRTLPPPNYTLDTRQTEGPGTSRRAKDRAPPVHIPGY